MNDSLKVKKNLVVDGLADAAGDICASSNPSGGLFVWVRFPDDVDQAKLARLAAERGFFYASGANFHIHGDEVPYLRLAFGHVPDDDIRDGIPILPNACARRGRATKRRHSRGSSTKTTAKRSASSGQTGCKSASSKSSLAVSADNTASSLKIRIASADSSRLQPRLATP